jgi:hypothetical protein
MWNRDCRRWLLIVTAFVISSFWSLTCAAQGEKPWQLPAALRPSLEARVNLFTDAQAEGRWDQVALLLGDYRRAGNYYLRYTPAHKACLIMQMKAAPMIAFTFTVQESFFSSEILTTPPGRRWWVLVGEGVFRVGTDTVTRRILVTAYRDRDDWYFTPATYFDDEVWARTHLTDKEVAADHKDQVDLLVPPDCPLELVALHVLIDARNISSRHVQFQLHNKSSEQVIAYSVEISDERQDGSIYFGTGASKDAIEPGGLSRKFEENYSAYSYWCEGEARMRIEIQDVTFANGTVWKAPRSSTPAKMLK